MMQHGHATKHQPTQIYTNCARESLSHPVRQLSLCLVDHPVGTEQ